MSLCISEEQYSLMSTNQFTQQSTTVSMVFSPLKLLVALLEMVDALQNACTILNYRLFI